MGLGVLGEESNEDRRVAPLGGCTVCGKNAPPDEFRKGWRLLNAIGAKPISSVACPACLPVALRRVVKGVRVDGVRFDPTRQAWEKDPES
jgi:hypothetical protein